MINFDTGPGPFRYGHARLTVHLGARGDKGATRLSSSFASLSRPHARQAQRLIGTVAHVSL